jgi:hypothetical protein
MLNPTNLTVILEEGALVPPPATVRNLVVTLNEREPDALRHSRV